MPASFIISLRTLNSKAVLDYPHVPKILARPSLFDETVNHWATDQSLGWTLHSRSLDLYLLPHSLSSLCFQNQTQGLHLTLKPLWTPVPCKFLRVMTPPCIFFMVLFQINSASLNFALLIFVTNLGDRQAWC